jgi:TonB family protein
MKLRREPVFLLCTASMVSLIWPAAAAQTNDRPDGAATSASTSTPPQRIRVSQDVARALLVNHVSPSYPRKARKQHIQGTVVLIARINLKGEVADLSLVSSDAALAKAAMDAVKKWTFRPYLVRGRPSELETELALNFSLSTESRIIR